MDIFVATQNCSVDGSVDHATLLSPPFPPGSISVSWTPAPTEELYINSKGGWHQPGNGWSHILTQLVTIVQRSHNVTAFEKCFRGWKVSNSWPRRQRCEPKQFDFPSHGKLDNVWNLLTLFHKNLLKLFQKNLLKLFHKNLSKLFFKNLLKFFHKNLSEIY